MLLNIMDSSLLKKAGLTNGESKVYLALLELGTSTTGPIVEKSKVSRSIIYRILEKLMEKGLASQVIKEKTKYFQATQPHKILEYVEEREFDLNKSKEEIKKILPELISKQKASRQSEVQLYLGLKGVRTAYEHIYFELSKGDEFCFLGILPILSEDQEAYWTKDQKRRISTGIKCRLLFNKNTPEWMIKDRNRYKDCDARLMPSSIKTPAMFMTYKNTTLIILQYPNAIAIEIKNQDIKNSFQAYFEEYWKRSKKL